MNDNDCEVCSSWYIDVPKDKCFSGGRSLQVVLLPHLPIGSNEGEKEKNKLLVQCNTGRGYDQLWV